ncbi:MAG: aldo/keto reductase [Cyclobacteriaceae bacterium]|nr:aldo/keto reductase [Cyclobacteriaceae bacterium]
MSALAHTSALSSNLEVSRIIGGLWQVADQERTGTTLDLSTAAEQMNHYVQNGITTFDMADHYGSAELIAGSFNKGYSGAQFLTKWVPEPGTASRDRVRSAIEQSLQRMHTDSLHLLQFHAWNYADPRWLDNLFWLQELQEEGLIRNLGVTNFDSAHLHMALCSGIKIVSNQVSYSLIDQRAAQGLSQLCQEFQVKLLAFGTLAGGFLSEKCLDQSEPSDLTTWSQMKYKRFIDTAGGWERFQKVLATLNTLALEKDCTIANLATRYILEDPAVAAVIIGIRLGERNHSEENLKILNLELLPGERQRIRESIAQLDPIPGDCGDEYRKPPYLTASGDLSDHIASLPPPYAIEQKASGVKVFTGTVWEETAGFCRAHRQGNRILISGTTATHGDRPIGGSDPMAQTHFVIDKIEGVLQSLGASLEQVIRTRVYVSRMEDWQAVAKVHGQRFAHIQPANTLIRADLIGDEYLVEIEAEAEII